MLLIFSQVPNFVITIVICVAAVFLIIAALKGMVYIAYLPPKMWCYEGDVLKKKRRIPIDNNKFYELMTDMDDEDRFEILIKRGDMYHWEGLLIRMLASEAPSNIEAVKKYSFHCLKLQRHLYRITDTSTGKRWVIKCDDTDVSKVKYILERSY